MTERIEFTLRETATDPNFVASFPTADKTKLENTETVHKRTRHG